jgi:hypothetical protein
MNEANVVFEPELAIAAEAFVAEWNNNAECRQQAEARTTAHRPESFDGGAVAVVLAIATGVTSSLISELIKVIVRKLAAGRGQAVEPAVSTPDGGKLLVVSKTQP